MKRALPAVFLAATMLLSLLPQSVSAIGTFISASSRKDMVYSDSRHVLYITNGNSLLCYDTNAKSFLPPFNLGGYLMGIDISPDGNTLAVADDSHSSTELWVHLIDLPTGGVAQARFPLAFGEGGSYSVAFGADGQLLIASTYQGSGGVPLRRYNPSTGLTTILAHIDMDSMLCANADRSVIAFAEGNSSDGPFGRYRVSDGDLVQRSYSYGTSAYNYEIGVNRNATLYAIPTYMGTIVANSNLLRTGTVIGTYAGGQPIGVVFNPVKDMVYFPWATTTKIYAYDTTTWTKKAEYDFQNAFDHPGNTAFREGRLKMSNDGDKLFATVQGGVRYISFGSDPPWADDQTITTAEDTTKAFTLSAGDLQGDRLTYIVLQSPAHGILSGSSLNRTYTPNRDYNGSDQFTYKVTDGTEESAPATVSITITPVDDAPAAYSQNITLNEDTPTAITLTGYDAEGSTLRWTRLTSPAHGILTGTMPNLTYTPAADYYGKDQFDFKVNDGSMDSNTATVRFTVIPENDPPVADSQTVSTLEDQSVAITLTGSDIEGDILDFDIVDAPACGTLGGSLPNLTYTPDADYCGADGFTFRIGDGTDYSTPAYVDISVASVNDPPTFELSGDSMLTKHKGRAVVVPGWATNISFGPANETGQSVTFVTANDHPECFLIQPAIDSSGTLTFTPDKAKKVTATITVCALDSGGTENGGVCESASQNFTIMVK